MSKEALRISFNGSSEFSSQRNDFLTEHEKGGKSSQNNISNNCENNNRLLDSVNCNGEVLIHEMEGVCPLCYQGYLFNGEDANIQAFLLGFLWEPLSAGLPQPIQDPCTCALQIAE